MSRLSRVTCIALNILGILFTFVYVFWYFLHSLPFKVAEVIKHKLRKLESESELEQLGNIGDEVGEQVVQAGEREEQMETDQKGYNSDASVEEGSSGGEQDGNNQALVCS